MSISRTCTCIYILIISCLVVFGCQPVHAQAADTVATDSTAVHKAKKKDLAGHQLNIGVDVVRPVVNYLVSNKYGYIFGADYYMRYEMYLAAEGGWGGSNVSYPDLAYKTTNSFLRFGFNKCVLARNNPNDWDMMFVGLRVGAADVKRTPATFTVVDSVWGNTAPGSTPGQNFLAVWGELTGGMRVEVAKGLMAGWNLSGRFILNGRSFNDLSPLYIAGYGEGDKNVVFDFSLYISYGIRWKRKNGPMTGSPNGSSDSTATKPN